MQCKTHTACAVSETYRLSISNTSRDTSARGLRGAKEDRHGAAEHHAAAHVSGGGRGSLRGHAILARRARLRRNSKRARTKKAAATKTTRTTTTERTTASKENSVQPRAGATELDAAQRNQTSSLSRPAWMKASWDDSITVAATAPAWLWLGCLSCAGLPLRGSSRSASTGAGQAAAAGGYRSRYHRVV